MFLYFTVLYAFVITANAVPLSLLFKPCPEHPADALNQCIFDNLQSFKPYLINDQSDLMSRLSEIVFPYSLVNSSDYEIALWNYNLRGFDDFHIQKVDADLKNNLFKFEILFPYLEGVGSYGCKGKLFNLKLDSTGQIRANATNYILRFDLKTELVQRHGQSYFKQKYLKTDIIVPDGVFYLHLDDLYLGNDEITENMNRILNLNSYYLFEVLIPILENRINYILGESLDKFFEIHRYDLLFI